MDQWEPLLPAVARCCPAMGADLRWINPALGTGSCSPAGCPGRYRRHSIRGCTRSSGDSPGLSSLRDPDEPLNMDKCRYFGSDIDGGFAEFAVIDYRNVYPVDSARSDEELATFELLFEETEGDLLSTAEANDLIADLCMNIGAPCLIFSSLVNFGVSELMQACRHPCAYAQGLIANNLSVKVRR